MRRVLFVCVGNVCRSPLAELLLRRMADERGVAVEVASAGIWAAPGQGMDSETAACALRHRLDGSAHVARPVTPAALASAEVVVALDVGAAGALHGIAVGMPSPPPILLRPVLNPWGMEAPHHETAYEQIAAVCAAVCAEVVAMTESNTEES